jgi:hypothetical protein
VRMEKAMQELDREPDHISKNGFNPLRVRRWPIKFIKINIMLSVYSTHHCYCCSLSVVSSWYIVCCSREERSNPDLRPMTSKSCRREIWGKTTDTVTLFSIVAYLSGLCFMLSRWNGLSLFCCLDELR